MGVFMEQGLGCLLSTAGSMRKELSAERVSLQSPRALGPDGTHARRVVISVTHRVGTVLVCQYERSVMAAFDRSRVFFLAFPRDSVITLMSPILPITLVGTLCLEVVMYSTPWMRGDTKIIGSITPCQFIVYRNTEPHKVLSWALPLGDITTT